mgnify:CR=1 FL=1
MPYFVSQYNSEIQQEIADHLNPPKEQGNDWRLVASKLNFSNNVIEKMKADQSQNPAYRLLQNCTNITTDKFLAVLTDPKVERKDVIGVMWECAKPPDGTRERSPTQESVSSSWCSPPSSPFDREMPQYDPSCPDSGIGRYEILSILSTLGVTGGAWSVQLVRSLCLPTRRSPVRSPALPRFQSLCDLLFPLSQLSFPSFWGR